MKISQAVCIAISLTFLFSIPVFADSDVTYKVFHVKGIIQVKSSGKILKPGNKICAKEKLIFKTQDAKAAVISSNNERMTLKPDKLKKEKNGELIDYFENIVFPSEKRVSTRAGALNNLLDLQKHFSEDAYLILSMAKIKINPESFPMSESSFFYLRYKYQGQMINKKLGYDGDFLIIDKDSLYMVDGKGISPEETADTQLYYYKVKKGQKPVSTKIANFNPVFPDEKQLKLEVGILVSELKKIGKKGDEIENGVLAFLNEFYGKPDLVKVRARLLSNNR